MDILCDQARQAGVLIDEPKDFGYPVGYWAFLRDPDGHTLVSRFCLIAAPMA
ncbi:MAG: hypothetical protein RLZZ507_4502 [Cyanobacteriota bacterium]|jgi:hypothetical protein